MRIKTLSRRIEKWIHEFPLVHGIGIYTDMRQPDKKFKLGISIYHDRCLSKEDREKITSRIKLEDLENDHLVYWFAGEKFKLEQK